MEKSWSIFREITALSLEQATVLPYLSFRLVQDGVRVIRMEHPVICDPNRMVGDPFVPGEDKMCSYFFAFNSGKEAITLNLKEPRGQEILRRLIRALDVDIFMTNQLPKSYQPLGIDYDSLRSVKPDIIWVGVTGFGPDSNEAAYDPILQARGGLMDLTGEPTGDPQVMAVPLPDMGTSEHAYGLVMKALFKRAVTGEGSRIDLAMFQSTVSWLTQPITMATTFGRIMKRKGNTHEFFSPTSVFPTSDGYVYLATGNNAQWQRLVSLPGFEHLAEPRYETNAGRIADVRELNRRLSKVTKKFTTAELLELLRSIQVPVSKVQSIPEVCEDPAIKDKFLRSEDPVTGFKVTMAPPPTLTDYIRDVGQTLSFPPRLGEHNEAIYGGVLGMSQEELESLKRDGVI